MNHKNQKQNRARSLHRLMTRMAMACVLLCVAACFNGQTGKGGENADRAETTSLDSGDSNQAAKQFEVDVVDFINESGIEPKFPQLWIYRAGELVSTELSYRMGEPLNIQKGESGPVSVKEAQLAEYLISNEVKFNRWKSCGADYCVVQVAPDPSLLKNCEGCNRMKSALDAYFMGQGSSVAYRSILLTNKIAPNDRKRGM